MRIDSIDLVRFGHFADRQIDLPARTPDFYLLYGNNEAGKSTLLRAISGLLFGIPSKTTDTHTFKGSELRIGATISAPGQSLSFRRRKGTTSTLLTPEETQMKEDSMTPFLRELDRERFEQFFALNHERLREGGEELLQGKGDIGSALFQAAGLLDLRKLLENLDKEARELFSPKSRGKVIGTALEEYREARDASRHLAISATTAKEKKAEMQAAEENLKKLRADSESLQRDLVRLRRIEGNKPDVARLQELRAALDSTASLPSLPISARRNRDEAGIALTTSATQVQALTQQITQRKQQIAELPLSAAFRGHEQHVEQLNAEISDYIRAVNDLPKRRSEYEEAVGLAESEWKQIWRSRPVSDAEQVRAAYLRKAEILDLINEQTRLTTLLQQAEEQLRAGLEQERRIQEELAEEPEPRDASSLIAAIEQAKSLGDVEQAAARLRSEIERLQDNATGDLYALPLFAANLQALSAMKTPLPATIERYARAWDEAAARRKQSAETVENSVRAITEKEAEIAAFAAELGKTAESDLLDARARRDQLWRLIRAHAFEQNLSVEEAQTRSGASVPLPVQMEERVRQADEIADRRFLHAKKVAIHDRLFKEIEALRIQHQQAEVDAARYEEEQRQLEQSWQSEWDLLAATPLAPGEMKDWLRLRQTILDRFQQVRGKQDELRLLQERAGQAAQQLLSELERLHFQAGSGQSLSISIKVAEKFAQELDKKKRSRDEFRRALKSLSIDTRKQTVNDCTAALSAWSQKWIPFVRALFLPEIATPAQVSDALIVLEKVFGHLAIADGLKHRIKRIGDNIESFEKRAAELTSTIDPALSTCSLDQAVASLHSRFVETGKADRQRETLEAQNAADESALASARTQAQNALSALEQMRALAGCKDDQQLESIITSCEQRAARLADYERISAGLKERNAVSDLKQVEDEAASYELDSLRSQIDSGERRMKELQDELIAVGTAYGELRKEYQRLESSSESAAQAQKAEEALAKVRPAIGQYLRLRLAFEAVQRAIESYREKHQGPVLKRARELFSALTLGDFSALVETFSDDDKQVLKAQRTGGELVDVEGLSDGTRDQLYLSLRLAFIEHHVATVAPFPVVLDDILINFDDARSLATLEVISSLAKRTQVLFFTHHRR
ncbi:MAG: AAA family ATPase, partial [Acidobacteria bacterium]|nr:AAA family ATPase [Acidobacteriota bacterium]